MKTTYIIFSFLIFNFLPAQQPQWQWANRGGSFTQPGNGYIQYASAVVADTAGNSYATGVINSDLASFSNPYGPPYITTYGNMDIFLAKYDCGGNLVWLDILGSAGGDYPNGLELGTDGMLYLLGNVGASPFYIKTNTSTTSYSFDLGVVFISKFNQDGALLKFNKFDQTFTGNPTIVNGVSAYLSINFSGNPVMLMSSFPGTLSPNITLLDTGLYIVNVDTGLNVLSAKLCAGSLKIAAPIISKIKVDDEGNIAFIANITLADTVEIGGVIITKNHLAAGQALAGSLDTNCILRWYDKGVNPTGDGITSFDLDEAGNMIAYTTPLKNDTIFTYIIHYTGDAPSIVTILKLAASSGALIWGKNGNNDTTCYNNPVGYILSYKTSDIYLTGSVTGYEKYDSLTIGSVPTGNPYVLRLDSNGNAINAYQMQGNAGPNLENVAYSMAIDEQGEAYIAGTFSGSLNSNGDTIQIANGGEQTDIFVAKFGLPCGDTNSLIPPLAPSNLVATATGPQAITVTWQNNAQYVQRFRIYRSLDAVTWAVIDSVPANITTYIDVNVQQSVVYWYKASAVNNVGESQFTNSDSAEIIPQAIADMAQNNIQMLIQPNPNKGNFTLTLATDANAAAQLTIYNVDGQQVLAQPVQIVAGNNWYPIQMPDAPAGVYIVQVNGENGGLGRMKFVME